MNGLIKMNVGLFIDGYTFKKVNEYYRYHHSRQSCIDFRVLKLDCSYD